MIAEKLKKSILQEAIRGRLVPQNPEDEPASVLLEKIREEKRELVKAGKIRADKQESIIFRGSDDIEGTISGRFYERIGKRDIVDITEELPFNIPESWEWVRIGYFTKAINGRAFKPSDWTSYGLPIIRIQNLNDIRAKYNFYAGEVDSKFLINNGDLLFAWSGTPGTSFGAHIWEKGKAILNQHIFKLEFEKSLFYKQYYVFAINQQVDKLIKQAHGAVGLQHITKSIFENTFIPVPPIEEQKRIVSALDDLLPKISEYQKIETKIHQVNISFPDKFRKSILQAAIQGRLVPQNPDDEPASELLEKIRKEKQELVKSGKIKADKQESVIFRGTGNIKGTLHGRFYERIGKGDPIDITDELPFVIPDSWEWVRLKEICTLISGQDLSPSQYSTIKDGIPYITGASNIIDDNIIINRWTKYPKKIAKYGDLLIICKGSVGKLAILNDGEVHIARQIMALRNIFSKIYFPYIITIIKNIVDKLQHISQGIIPGIERNDILEITVPLPPHEEQKRIVETINNIIFPLSTL